MAVIKIVPMPGAKGAKGDEGETGSQGPQGETGLQGPAGADALWSYNGSWQSNASYAEGDVVTYDGQLYYATGVTTLGTTPDVDNSFDLIATKGADGGNADIADFIFTDNEEDSSITLPGDKEMIISAGENSDLYLTAGDDLYVTANGDDIHIRAGDDIRFTSNYESGEEYYWRMNSEGTFVVPGGIYTSSENNLLIESDGSAIVLLGYSGEFLGSSEDANNQIATVGDINAVYSGEQEFTVNGGTLGTQPTFNGAPLFSGSYVKTGSLVHFQIQVDMDNITSFGTGQYYVDLPFPAKYAYQVRNGCLHDISTGLSYEIGGHVFAGESRLLLSSTDAQGNTTFDIAFTSTAPVLLDVADNFHISGTYISE